MFTDTSLRPDFLVNEVPLPKISTLVHVISKDSKDIRNSWMMPMISLS